MITTTIKYDQRKIKLTSVYFSHSGYADMHIEKMYENIETHCNNIQHIRIIEGDFDAQLGPGIHSERDHTTGQSNKRGIWVKQQLMIQNYVALNTTFKKKQSKTIQFQILK